MLNVLLKNLMQKQNWKSVLFPLDSNATAGGGSAAAVAATVSSLMFHLLVDVESESPIFECKYFCTHSESYPHHI